MPHLETVAGDATDRSATSNSILMVAEFSFRRSPLGRHRVQLSSSTCESTDYRAAVHAGTLQCIAAGPLIGDWSLKAGNSSRRQQTFHHADTFCLHRVGVQAVMGRVNAAGKCSP